MIRGRWFLAYFAFALLGFAPSDRALAESLWTHFAPAQPPIPQLVAAGKQVNWSRRWPMGQQGWIEISLIAKLGEDIRPLVHGFAGSDLRSVTLRLPCHPVDSGRMRCKAQTFIDGRASSVRFRILNQGASDVELQSIEERFVIVEARQSESENPLAVAADKLLSKISSLYYRQQEVDWQTLRARSLFIATSAPPGLDPLPHIALYVLQQLPDARHSSVILRSRQQEHDYRLPSCTKKGRTTRLQLPVTPPEQAVEDYIRVAQSCLLRATNKIELDLTDSTGGDVAVLIAAVAPILPDGLLLVFKNAWAQEFPVTLSRNAVMNGGELVRPFPALRAPNLKTPVVARTSDACASACEMLLVALRGRVAHVGSVTAGLTTANELIHINEDFDLQLTAGLVMDKYRQLVTGPIFPTSLGR